MPTVGFQSNVIKLINRTQQKHKKRGQQETEVEEGKPQLVWTLMVCTNADS